MAEKRKILTFSYDDGVEQDRRLLEILNKYGLKGTFNLNSGIQTAANTFMKGDVLVKRMNVRGLPALYAGHEIAVHSLTHPHLEKLDAETVRNELEQDKINLERLFGRQVTGMVYPFGTWNDTVLDVIRGLGFAWGREVASSRSFEPPRKEEILCFKPTCHHADGELMRLAEDFIKAKPESPKLFYLWGHSYEFEADRNWNVIEEFCRMMAGRDDIAYLTNTEAFKALGLAG